MGDPYFQRSEISANDRMLWRHHLLLQEVAQRRGESYIQDNSAPLQRKLLQGLEQVEISISKSHFREFYVTALRMLV